MEATTAPSTVESTGSKTIADLLPKAAEKYADKVAVKFKDAESGEWRDVTFREVGEIVSEIGRGLIDLGIEPGDRVSLLCNTRAEWTYADFAISTTGAVVVPIYPTNSPEECEWVAGNSDSVAIVCEDATQVAKIAQVRENLPNLEHVIVIDGGGDVGDAITVDALRERGRGRDTADVLERAGQVKPEDPFTFIYTSGTTGPPKGCVLTHDNYRKVLDSVETRGMLGVNDDDLTYLFLPLAHAFALLIQLVSFDVGAPIAYFGGDTKAIVGELGEVKPTYLPSVPRIFEKVYAMAQGNLQPEQLKAIREIGGRIQDLEVRGEPVPDDLKAQWEPLAPVAGFVKNLFGGRLREAVTGAAPISPEILEFFWGCGIPVLEGYGMTETATVATSSTPEEHKFGTVGKALPGVELKIAEDGEVLIKGANIFQGYYKNADASFGAVEEGWLHTGDLGSLDEDGFLSITGRKKDIIITAGGKNLTPANFENDLKQHPFVSQCVMHGDRRPYPTALITLDEETVVPWAEKEGLPTDVKELAEHPKVREVIQGIVDGANQKYAQVEQVKKFVILDHDFSQETGEMTPSLKVKRNVVNEKYAPLFDELYS
jgi:long-chain acyl-CoA synthetase